MPAIADTSGLLMNRGLTPRDYWIRYEQLHNV